MYEIGTQTLFGPVVGFAPGTRSIIVATPNGAQAFAPASLDARAIEEGAGRTGQQGYAIAHLGPRRRSLRAPRLAPLALAA